ncbi:unnamed protein product [Rangifer tarandus platyrhynchus]|uniref:Uncharacterized protein n=2 Tax=Rangifer tarandus platyrhynchus TaxID=3082113 RepID=A0ACB0EH39_RANTA|nr:unnamed protein product [Rangifer tarandus platyrhynchus]CAI9699699.1 unnamed protein product [Rangifer tarandus platyrhynchus]
MPHATRTLPPARAGTGRGRGYGEEPGAWEGRGARRRGAGRAGPRDAEAGWLREGLGVTERRTGGSSQTTGDAETGRQREGGRGRGSRRRRERVAAARALPADTLLCPREAAGGTEWQNERDAGAEDQRRVPASLVGPRVAEGPPRGAARRADRETAGSPWRLPDRGTDGQTDRRARGRTGSQEAGARSLSAARGREGGGSAPRAHLSSGEPQGPRGHRPKPLLWPQPWVPQPCQEPRRRRRRLLLLAVK